MSGGREVVRLLVEEAGIPPPFDVARTLIAMVEADASFAEALLLIVCRRRLLRVLRARGEAEHYCWACVAAEKEGNRVT